MSKVQLRQLDPDHYAVDGPLTFESVPLLWREGLQPVFRQPRVILDLSGVTHTDSAGLALMIQWMRSAEQQHCRLCFRSVPEQLLAIASATGVEHLFASDAEP